jgi:hypothetical protein
MKIIKWLTIAFAVIYPAGFGLLVFEDVELNGLDWQMASDHLAAEWAGVLGQSARFYAVIFGTIWGVRLLLTWRRKV